MLALHGFPDLPHTFHDQMQALAQAGYRVVAPYMRGYFPTEAPPDVSYEAAALAQDVLALIDALADQPVILIGHDWGAAAAYRAAVLAPERIARLITIAVPYGEIWWNALLTNPAQQRRSWYMFFMQLPFAEAAIAHNDFAFLERLWQDWSPGWRYPPDALQAVKDTFRQPGVLTAALNYYRHSLNPPGDQSELQAIRERAGSRGQVAHAAWALRRRDLIGRRPARVILAHRPQGSERGKGDAITLHVPIPGLNGDELKLKGTTGLSAGSNVFQARNRRRNVEQIPGNGQRGAAGRGVDSVHASGVTNLIIDQRLERLAVFVPGQRA
ncbi:MAG: alpha/beta fold hydrolase [Anaerolineales bacterium]|nr:alpha/beta fold hydrolase [Anaerolineales bacterium]